MSESFTKDELSHILTMMNAYSDPGCETCSEIRKKLEKMIEGKKEERS